MSIQVLIANKRLALIMLLIICSGDIETSPGPKKNTNISFSHWNLNGIATHNFSKVSLLQTVATTHDHGIIYISQKRFMVLCLTALMTKLILKDTISIEQTTLMIIRGEEFVCILNINFQF